MRKLFWQMMVSLDGLMEGPHGENLEDRIALKLLKSRTLRSGVVILDYEPGNRSA